MLVNYRYFDVYWINKIMFRQECRRIFTKVNLRHLHIKIKKGCVAYGL